MPNIKMRVGDSRTLPTNTFIRARYDFTGWVSDYGNTYANGGVMPLYSQMVGYTINLHTQWRQQTYKVVFDENKPAGVTGAVTGMPADITTGVGTDTTVPNNTPALNGYTFRGWDNSGTMIASGGTIATQPADTVVTLKARWKLKSDAPVFPDVYKVVFDENKPVGASANVNGMPFSPVALLVGMSYVVPNDVPMLTGYDFDGWDNSGAKIVAGAIIASQPANTTVTPKATWTP